MIATALQRLPSPFIADRPPVNHPLPAARHRPGTGTTPDLPPLEAAKARTPQRTSAAAWRDNVPYLYGIDLFESAYYWEAHEVWEPVWMNCAPNSAERHLLQALIQYANAALKRDMGRERATYRLLAMCRGHLRDLPSTSGTGDLLMGVDLGRWRADLESRLAANSDNDSRRDAQ